MARKKFRLQVIDIVNMSVDLDVVSLRVIGADGEIGILANHQPLLSLVAPGVISYTTPDGEIFNHYISGGFMEAGRNLVKILADKCSHDHKYSVPHRL